MLATPGLLYDYKSELTGVGNRSQINADDVIYLHFCTAYCCAQARQESHAYVHYTSLLCFACFTELVFVNGQRCIIK